jgi:hypothetical protein
MCRYKMKILGLFICLSISISVLGQMDCVIHFTYTWTVETETNREIELGLPTTPFLVGYETKNDERSFAFAELNSGEASLGSHLRSDFCMDYDRIIERVFKGDKSYYLLKLRTKKNEKGKKFKIKEIKIPIDSINFSIDKEERRIIIQLPTIKTF